MAKEKKQTKKVVKQSSSAGCGAVPKNPGGAGIGEWQCRDGVWVWIEDIGGK